MKEQLSTREFVKSLRDGAPQELSSAKVDRLILDHLADSGDHSRKALLKCCRELERLNEIEKDGNGAEDEANRLKSADDIALEPHQHENDLITLLVLNELAPRVDKIRQDLFGSAEPPFSTEEEAVAWIESEGKSIGKGREPANLKRTREVCDEIAKCSQELQELCGVVEPILIQTPTLKYSSPGTSMVSRIHLPTGSPLVPLKYFVKTVSNGTGISDVALLSHVLVGTHLRIPRISVSAIAFPITSRPDEYIVKIRAYNVTAEDFRAAYQTIRKRGERPAPFDRIDLAVARARINLGEPPEKGDDRMGYYERLAKLARRELKTMGAKLNLKDDAFRSRLARLEKKIAKSPEFPIFDY